MSGIQKKLLIIFSTLVFFVLDRLIKYLFLENIFDERYFFITLLYNKGIAFGIQLPAKFYFIFYILLIIIFLLLINLLIKFWKQKNYLKSWASLLVLLGATSNVIDRIKFGAVIDFIDLKIWPVFNLADIMIVGGVIILFISHARFKNIKICHGYQ